MKSRELTGVEAVALTRYHMDLIHAKQRHDEYLISLLRSRGLEPSEYAVDLKTASIVPKNEIEVHGNGKQ